MEGLLETVVGTVQLAIAVALFCAVEYFGARWRGELDDDD